MPEQEHGRSPPETVTMASSGEPQPHLPGLAGDPTAGRSDMATMVTGGGSDEEEAMGTAGGPLGDFVLIGTPWGLLLAPTPLSSMKPEDEEVSDPPFPENMMPPKVSVPRCGVPAAAPGGSEKQCVQCGATETPQWRIQPVGLGALCNACRIWLRPAEALREPVHVRLPPPATATTVISRREKSPSPAPATAPEVKKQKRKRKPWQEQEDRPVASPNLKPSEHACKQYRGKEHHQPPQPAAMQPRTAHELPTGEPISLDHQLLLDAIDGSPETHIVYGVGGELQMADPSSLDEFLFNGPAAPPLIDDEEEDDLAD